MNYTYSGFLLIAGIFLLFVYIKHGRSLEFLIGGIFAIVLSIVTFFVFPLDSSSEEIPGISIQGKNSELRKCFYAFDFDMKGAGDPFIYTYSDSINQFMVFYWPYNSTWYLNEDKNIWYSYQYYSRTFGEISLDSEFTDNFYSFWKENKFLETASELVSSSWHSVSLNNFMLTFSSESLDKKVEGIQTLDFLLYSEKEILSKFCKHLK